MKFIFTDDYIKTNSKFYVHFLRRKYANLEHDQIFCDIQSYIHENQQSLLNDIEKWHSDLTNFHNQKSKYWSFNLSSRLIIFHPPVFLPLIFTIGVIEYCKKKKINSLQLVNCPNEVLQYISELSPNSEVLDLRNNTKEKFAFIDNIFKIAKFAAKFLISAFSYSKAKEGIKHVNNIVFTYSASQENLESFDDRYFGKMFEDNAKLKYNDTLWLYVKDGSASIHNKLEDKKWNFVHVLHYLTFVDVFKCLLYGLLEYILLYYRSRRFFPIRLSAFESMSFYRNYLNGLMLNHIVINEFATYFVLKRLLYKYDIKNIIFPMEGKSMEKAILLAAKENKIVQTIGYMHSFSHNIDSCLKSDTLRSIKLNLEPDKIATPGENVKDWMQKWGGYSKEKFVNFGSPKYQQLTSRRPNKIKPCILIVLGINEELYQLANIIEIDNTIFDSFEVILRPGPTFAGLEQNKQINRILSMTNNVKLNNNSMIEQIKESDFVIFNITSVGIESVLLGRLAIYLSLSNVIEIDSLDGKADKDIFFNTNNTNDLKINMSTILKLTKKDYSVLLNKQRKYAKNIYSQVNFNNIKNTLN
jgi:hypothetical protein